MSKKTYPGLGHSGFRGTAKSSGDFAEMEQHRPSTSAKKQTSWLLRSTLAVATIEVIALGTAAIVMSLNGTMSWFPLAFGVIFGGGVTLAGAALTIVALLRFARQRSHQPIGEARP